MVPRLANTYLFGQYLHCKYCGQDRIGAWFNQTFRVVEYVVDRKLFLSFDCSICNRFTLEGWFLGTA